MHVVRRALVACSALVPVAIAVACGSSPSPQPQPPPVASVAMVDAAPPPEDAAPAKAPFVDGRAEMIHAPLPSGDYEVTTEVKTDTCTNADSGAVGPEPVTLFVQMKVWRDKSGKVKIAGNFPLPLPRVKWMGFGSARSDITLDPPEDPKPFSIHGMGSQCPAYETKTLYRVLHVVGNEVKVEYSREYGDASTCTAKAHPPSKCTLEYVYTYKLVNKVCDARCGVTYTKSGDGGLSPKCLCEVAAP